MRPRTSEAGFSMVEMLMAAFILATGILGISMLQVMSLRAARGSQNLTVAILLAERVLDQVEMEARLSWLNVTDTDLQTPSALNQLQYVGKDSVPDQTFNAAGQPTATDLTDATPVYTVKFRHADISAGATGQTTDFTVTVSFVDLINAATNTPVTRSVELTRRIVHG